MDLFNLLRFVINHPLNANQRVKAIYRLFSWQVASRLLPGPSVVNYVNDSRLIVRRGMTGATGNIYAGLHEFEDMSFVLHSLRPGDLFIDVGANVGSYTILAAAVAGAKCLSFEPIPSTYLSLLDNININKIGDIVDARNMGVGREFSTLYFTSNLDTINHVAATHEVEDSFGIMKISVDCLDNLISIKEPVLMKIDVEGFETEVIAGAHKILAHPMLLGVIMELNGSGNRYGYDEAGLHVKMLEYGLNPFMYSPFERALTPIRGKSCTSGNTLYVKNLDVINQRVQAAPQFHANNCWV